MAEHTRLALEEAVGQAERFDRATRRIADLTVTEEGMRGAVRVTVSAGGALRDLRIGRHLRGGGGVMIRLLGRLWTGGGPPSRLMCAPASLSKARRSSVFPVRRLALSTSTTRSWIGPRGFGCGPTSSARRVGLARMMWSGWSRLTGTVWFLGSTSSGW
jgi:hypothetical protein